MARNDSINDINKTDQDIDKAGSSGDQVIDDLKELWK